MKKGDRVTYTGLHSSYAGLTGTVEQVQSTYARVIFDNGTTLWPDLGNLTLLGTFQPGDKVRLKAHPEVEGEILEVEGEILRDGVSEYGILVRWPFTPPKCASLTSPAAIEVIEPKLPTLLPGDRMYRKGWPIPIVVRPGVRYNTPDVVKVERPNRPTYTVIYEKG